MFRWPSAALAVLGVALAHPTRAADFIVPTAYPTIQAAIDAAAPGDRVIVGAGVYSGPGNYELDFKGKPITVRSTAPADPQIVAATIIDCAGLGRGFVLGTNETTDAVIDGLTITRAAGGGVSCGISVGVTVRRCVLTQCTDGAVRVAAHSTLVMDDCQVVGNSGAQFIAGGINAAYLVTVRLSRTLVSDNTDGGLNMVIADLVMTDCVVRDNTNARTVRPVAGGLQFDQGFNAATLSRCRFENNYSAVRGGGIYFYTVNVPCQVDNCVFAANTAAQAGGGVTTFASYEGSFLFQNCTFADNAAPQSAAAWCTAVQGQNRTTLDSCIVWGNPGASQIEGAQTVTFCNVEGGFPGAGNTSADPLFVDALAGDYHLSPASPCINAGDPGFAPTPQTRDLDGDPRRMGRRVDQGADEFRLRLTAVALADQ